MEHLLFIVGESRYSVEPFVEDGPHLGLPRGIELMELGVPRFFLIFYELIGRLAIDPFSTSKGLHDTITNREIRVLKPFTRLPTGMCAHTPDKVDRNDLIRILMVADT